MWAALAGEVVASMVEDDPLPLDRDLLAALDPGRMRRRDAARAEDRHDVDS